MHVLSREYNFHYEFQNFENLSHNPGVGMKLAFYRRDCKDIVWKLELFLDGNDERKHIGVTIQTPSTAPPLC